MAGDGTDRPGLRGWWRVVRRTAVSVLNDGLLDWAAALTYYGVLSLFPGLIVVVSLVDLAGVSGERTLTENVRQFAPGPTRDTALALLSDLHGAGATAGTVASAGTVLALWSASRYVGALIRALNAVHDIGEGRPLWKLAPLRLALTLAIVVLLGASAVAVTFTGWLTVQAGRVFGLSSAFVTGWNIAKWPVLVAVAVVAIATLYRAGPNVRESRWITPGCAVAIGAWIVASIGFAVYAANFGSYNRTYGALAAVVIFLVWMWVSNVAILIGAEFDAELARVRGRAVVPDEAPDKPVETMVQGART
ncbi:YihY/virulence factor BrkB family protein [Actinomadura rayongensis]|uniref:YihY family inner membrane protein n=1 Tax=Actinomadura rayongensis TaxID=1429076 RepID=A0A6I4W7A0_9ACTN|nr:YihY/virulence factor BrkB family protein [Actinomadura rayongensis]MXQ65163.1 YihY family inner membrane protein [Actinomadura rayongensis]